MFERKKKSLTSEPWGEQIITLAAARGEGRAEVGFVPDLNPLAPLQEDLQAREKEGKLRPISNGRDFACTVLVGCSCFIFLG